MTSQLAEKLAQCAVLKGHGFIRADKSIRMSAALAAEGRFCNFGSSLVDFFSRLFSHSETLQLKVAFSPCPSLLATI
jgi:hypothetical protein